MPGSQWNAASDRDLLLVIIDAGTLKSIDWQRIAQGMKDKHGYTFTHEACRQHFQKLRKDSKGSTSFSTPSKSDNTPASRKRSTAKKSTKETDPHTNSDDDEDLPIQTPSKKQKLGFKKEEHINDEQSAYRFKTENSGDLIDIEREDLYI